jgi:putative glutamine amidotransferase
MKPIIGITMECRHDPDDMRTRGKFELNWNYAEMVELAGGVPILIPPQADPVEVARILDGWLIPGGSDIDPKHWGEEVHPKAELQDPRRFESEIGIFRQVDSKMPIFGICYGCQFLNVALGGTVDQHIPDAIGHEHHSGGTLADYMIEPDSKLEAIVGESKISGKSYHHQAVGRVAPGLRVSARHEDGTVEAIESTERPWLLAVQWHPERSLDSDATKRLFQEFVSAARRYAEGRRA